MTVEIYDYKETRGFATKSWKKCYYSSCKFPVEFSDVLRPSAFQFRLLDSENNSWLEDQDNPSNLKILCTYVIPEGPYHHL
ncbi:hypothetical protein BJX66DRAFT_319735, partial [Aspergillus keveii]